MIQTQEKTQEVVQEVSQKEILPEMNETSMVCPYRKLTDHWLTISRPQYRRTCGISSLVSIWNYQFSKLGLGNKDPISIEQAMLKLNLIGNGSVEQNMRKKFKKTPQLTEKTENNEQEEAEDAEFSNAGKTLYEYIDTVDFGCFTGNDTLLKWYRLLCRIYGGSGRSYLFYKTNSDRSQHQSQQTARKGLVEGLNSGGKTCFIYHAHDHYFCPVGYEFMPKSEENDDGMFDSKTLGEEGSELYIMVGESSKVFPCMHVYKWSEIQLDLSTYWPKWFNIRRRNEGVQIREGKEEAVSNSSSINCIMAFQKMRD